MSTALTLTPTNMAEAMTFADVLAKSSMVPKEYQGRPANVLVGIAWGMELGLAPMQAMQNIAVINGKPSIYGDAALAVVMAHPACEDVIERIEGDGESMRALCHVKRKGKSPTEAVFSVADAKRAGLWGKSGPWTQYPKRMLQMRARGFALRDAFPDVLRGLITQEEARDYPQVQDFDARPAERSMGHAARVDDVPPPAAGPSIADLRNAARDAIARTSREDVLAELQRLGYTRADEVPADQRDAVIAALCAMNPVEDAS